VVLVTGDWAVTAEAKALSPNVHTVAVKDATGATSARNLHPGTDSGRGHQGGPGGEDDPAPSSKDPPSNWLLSSAAPTQPTALP